MREKNRNKPRSSLFCWYVVANVLLCLKRNWWNFFSIFRFIFICAISLAKKVLVSVLFVLPQTLFFFFLKFITKCSYMNEQRQIIFKKITRNTLQAWLQQKKGTALFLKSHYNVSDWIKYQKLFLNPSCKLLVSHFPSHKNSSR